MTDELPENNMERNAWHEAGHVVVAWHFDPRSVGRVAIATVVSRSFISRHKMTPEQRTSVSLAGCLTEACGISRRRAAGDFTSVAGCIVSHIDFREPDGAQWLKIPLEDGTTEWAAFSDDDFETIHPSHHGSMEALMPVFPVAIDVITQHFDDGRIARIVEELLAKHDLGGAEIRRLLN